MQQIHQKSDLVIFIPLNTEILTSDNQFTFIYYTTSTTNTVYCFWSGSNFFNCEVVEGGILAKWDCPNFEPGILKGERIYQRNDETFTDGKATIYEYIETDIYITDQAIKKTDHTIVGVDSLLISSTSSEESANPNSSEDSDSTDSTDNTGSSEGSDTDLNTEGDGIVTPLDPDFLPIG